MERIFNSTFVFLLLSFLLISCNEKPKEIKRLKIEHYLDSLQSKYPNHSTNTVIKDELNQSFQKDFKKAINDSILNDLPFKLDKVEKCNDRYILSLEHRFTSKYYKRDLLDDFEIELYATTDKVTAKKLTEGKFYLIDCSFINYINFQNNEKYCAYVLYSPFEGFGADISGHQIECGAIAVKLKNIKLFKAL